MLFDISIINFAVAFTQGIIESENTNTNIDIDIQQIPFNLKQWVNIESSDSDTVSALQADDKTIDFPDTSLMMAIDGNNNILNNGDTTSSTLLKLDFVGQIDLTGNSQIIFECKIDSSIFEQCTSPTIIDNLKVGEHIFEVRTIDQLGKVDETPAQFRWIIANDTNSNIDDDNDDATIDSSNPSTKITSIKDGKGSSLLDQKSTLSNSISISFKGSDDTTTIEALTFECKIDSSIFEQCTSPTIIDNLKVGEHIFEVRTIDQLGKVDETPAQFRWIVIDLAENLEEIKIIIEDGDISSVLKNNLNVILNEMQILVGNRNPNNDHEICNNLEEFNLQITSNIDDISIGSANRLVEKTNTVIENLRC